MVTAKKSGGSAVPLSQIEKSVTHLLVATKQLLETLTQWSRGDATDTQVSDVYVRLGYEFNMACRAFAAINVDTSDLGNVPELLRNILESTLSQEASSESLEKYLPKIRDIIINLLHGLKRKQQKLRQKQARDKENGGGEGSAPARTTSTSTMGSVNSGLTSLLNEGIENGYRPDADDSRNSSSPTRRGVPQRDQSRGSANSEQSSLSSSTMQSIPVLPPYPGDEATMPTGNSIPDLNSLDNFPPPPPPPPPAFVAKDFVVYFPFDQYVLTPEAQSVVQQAAQYANDGHATRIVVVGHTDTSGSVKYNLRLSERRAKAVADAMVGLGVAQDVMKVDWVGKTDLAVPTPDGVKEPLNRRSTISINF